jgi:hypothetical protein
MTDWEVVIIGRKGLYEEWLTEDGLTTIQGWARDGLTNVQIAKNIGVSERTFADWIARFPAFSAALKKGKAPVDFEVENALLKRALGYDYEEVITEIEEAPGGKQKKHIRKVQKHMPADTTAQIFWLKNRRPKRWRDRVETVPEVQNDLLQSLMDLERRMIHD